MTLILDDMGLSICAKFGKISIRTVNIKPEMDGQTDGQTDKCTELITLSSTTTPRQWIKMFIKGTFSQYVQYMDSSPNPHPQGEEEGKLIMIPCYSPTPTQAPPWVGVGK
jgi:hypothetical protein